jgi:membrane protein DedA with SNARE-associated domain
MTVLAGIAALAMATCVGYYFGRRAGSTPSTWRQRTSRIALGRLAITLLVSLTARRIRRSFRTERMLPGVAVLLRR